MPTKMKRTITTILLILATSFLSFAQEPLYAFRYDVKYRDIQYDFDTRDYQFSTDDPYDPVLAGIASLFLPGFGQCIDGEFARGVGFFFGQSAIAFVGTCLLCIPIYDYDILGNGAGNGFFRAAAPIVLGTLGAEAILGIWNICDAVHIAKVKNLYYRSLDQGYDEAAVDFRIEPSFAMTPNSTGALSPTAGVSLKLSF